MYPRKRDGQKKIEAFTPGLEGIVGIAKDVSVGAPNLQAHDGRLNTLMCQVSDDIMC